MATLASPRTDDAEQLLEMDGVVLFPVLECGLARHDPGGAITLTSLMAASSSTASVVVQV